jgi:predicted metalloendopeptidase
VGRGQRLTGGEPACWRPFLNCISGWLTTDCKLLWVQSVQLANLGGIETAYSADQKYRAVHGKAPVIGGLSGGQRFFLAYAQA